METAYKTTPMLHRYRMILGHCLTQKQNDFRPPVLCGSQTKLIELTSFAWQMEI